MDNQEKRKKQLEDSYRIMGLGMLGIIVIMLLMLIMRL